MVPWLATLARSLPATWAKFSWPPSMKLWSVTSKVVASRPATSTWEPAPKTIPLGLIRKMLPLACRAPWMFETWLPSTRFRVIESLPAFCAKRTSSPASMLKSVQLMMPFCRAWVITSSLLFMVPMLMPPCTATPPVGPARATELVAPMTETETALMNLCVPFFLRDISTYLCKWGVVSGAQKR